MAVAENSGGVAARGAALSALNAVLGPDGLMLAEIPEPDLPVSERARARRLAEETLRRIEPADRLLKPFLRKAPPLAVLNALRLAVVEMALGAPAHGVVNATVTLMRQGKKTSHQAGLVNAVLRQVDATALGAVPVQKLPRWMRQPMVHAWGRDVVAKIEEVHAAAAPLDLTTRPGAILPEGQVLPTGSLRLPSAGQVSAMAGYAEGGWWVQDAAASVPARLLNVQKGEKVLDLCAAPGGKTMQLAAAGADVTALDISEARVKRIRENLTRTGMTAEIVVADALVWAPDQQFDAILVDAPCSATGTLRRHPDLPFVKDGSEVEPLAALQRQILDRALTWLRPGGRLVFATCSLLPAEGEDQLAALQERHPDLLVIRPDLEGVDPAWITPAGGLRLRPDYWADQGGMDGFFCFAVQRPL